MNWVLGHFWFVAYALGLIVLGGFMLAAWRARSPRLSLAYAILGYCCAWSVAVGLPYLIFQARAGAL